MRCTRRTTCVPFGPPGPIQWNPVKSTQERPLAEQVAAAGRVLCAECVVPPRQTSDLPRAHNKRGIRTAAPAGGFFCPRGRRCNATTYRVLSGGFVPKTVLGVHGRRNEPRNQHELRTSARIFKVNPRYFPVERIRIVFNPLIYQCYYYCPFPTSFS